MLLALDPYKVVQRYQWSDGKFSQPAKEVYEANNVRGGTLTPPYLIQSRFRRLQCFVHNASSQNKEDDDFRLCGNGSPCIKC